MILYINSLDYLLDSKLIAEEKSAVHDVENKRPDYSDYERHDPMRVC